MRVRVNVKLLDGSALEAEGLMAPLADRVAFERRFETNAAVLGRIKEFFDDEGKLLPGADPGAMREEWVAFIVYRVLHRAKRYEGDFETFLEEAAELDLTELPEGSEPVPFETASPTPTS